MPKCPRLGSLSLYPVSLSYSYPAPSGLCPLCPLSYPRAPSCSLPAARGGLIMCGVPSVSPTPDSSRPADDPVVENVCDDAPEILDGSCPAPGTDFVPTAPMPLSKPAKGQKRALVRGTEISRVRGWAVREKVIELHVMQGLSLKQTARKIGRSYKRVCVVWRGVVADANGGTGEEGKRAVRAFCDQHLRSLVAEGQKGFSDNAAHGAVAVAALKELRELHGLKAEDGEAPGLPMEAVGQEVRVKSPLLLERIEEARRLGGLAASPEAAAAAARSKHATPVEGEPIRPEPATTCYNGPNAESEEAVTPDDSKG